MPSHWSHLGRVGRPTASDLPALPQCTRANGCCVRHPRSSRCSALANPPPAPQHFFLHPRIPECEEEASSVVLTTLSSNDALVPVLERAFTSHPARTMDAALWLSLPICRCPSRSGRDQHTPCERTVRKLVRGGGARLAAALPSTAAEYANRLRVAPACRSLLRLLSNATLLSAGRGFGAPLRGERAAAQLRPTRRWRVAAACSAAPGSRSTATTPVRLAARPQVPRSPRTSAT